MKRISFIFLLSLIVNCAFSQQIFFCDDRGEQLADTLGLPEEDYVYFYLYNPHEEEISYQIEVTFFQSQEGVAVEMCVAGGCYPITSVGEIGGSVTIQPLSLSGFMDIFLYFLSKEVDATIVTVKATNTENAEDNDFITFDTDKAVSYTHLTLPTKRIV